MPSVSMLVTNMEAGPAMKTRRAPAAGEQVSSNPIRGIIPLHVPDVMGMGNSIREHVKRRLLIAHFKQVS